MRADAWPGAGCRYVEAISLARDYIAAIDDAGTPRDYADRVAAEFDDAVRLAPSVVIVPSFESLGMADLLRLRATTARVVGLRNAAAFADGAVCTPAAFFWHDLDHLRFMVREDLAVLGVAIPDAYGAADTHGRRSTVDPATGRHRCILAAAVAPLAAQRAAHVHLMARAARTVEDLAARLDSHETNLPVVAAAARLTLFEVCHEKAYTPVPEILRRELSHDAHLAKMRLKLARRFWGAALDPALAGHLEAARTLLLGLVDELDAAA